MKQNSEESNDFKTLSQLGHDYQAKRQFQKALLYSKQAYELAKSTTSSDDLIVALVNMGAIYWEMSQLRKATDLFHDSLLIVEQTGDDVGRRILYSIIGVSSWRKGEFFNSIQYFEKALKATSEAKVEHERSQLVPPWKYEILQVVMERGIEILKNRIHIAQNQNDSVRVLLPSFAMVPLMIFTGRIGEVPNLLKEIVPLAKELKKNNYLDKETGEKIPEETIKLLNIQKDVTIKQLIKIPALYETKNNTLIKASIRAHQFLWRMCESYELWCRETGQSEQLLLNIID